MHNQFKHKESCRINLYLCQIPKHIVIWWHSASETKVRACSLTFTMATTCFQRVQHIFEGHWPVDIIGHCLPSTPLLDAGWR